MQCLRLYRLIFSIRNVTTALFKDVRLHFCYACCGVALNLTNSSTNPKARNQSSHSPTSTVQTSEFVYRCAGSGQLCYILSSALNWLDRNPTTILRYTTTRYATLDDVNVIDHRKPLLLGLVICSVNNER
ncbi:Melanopsin [Trichinella pseudospiralis]